MSDGLRWVSGRPRGYAREATRESPEIWGPDPSRFLLAGGRVLPQFKGKSPKLLPGDALSRLPTRIGRTGPKPPETRTNCEPRTWAASSCWYCSCCRRLLSFSSSCRPAACGAPESDRKTPDHRMLDSGAGDSDTRVSLGGETNARQLLQALRPERHKSRIGNRVQV